jgi:hypothetical protein
MSTAASLSFLSNLSQLAEVKTPELSLNSSHLYATDDGDIITVGLFDKALEEVREKTLGLTNRTSMDVIRSRVLTILKKNKKNLTPKQLKLISQIATNRKLTDDNSFAEALKLRSNKILKKYTILETAPSAQIKQSISSPDPLVKEAVEQPLEPSKVALSVDKYKTAKVALAIGSAALAAFALYELSNSHFTLDVTQLEIAGTGIDVYKHEVISECFGNWCRIYDFITGGCSETSDLNCWFEMRQSVVSYKQAMKNMVIILGTTSIAMTKHLIQSKSSS